MKTALVLALSLSALAFAQDEQNLPLSPDQKQDQEGQAKGLKRRLDSVTWNLKTHKLVWVVQSGSDVDGKFVASKTEKYEISPDQAVMAVAKEQRGFTAEEAKSLHKLLDVLSLYCAESVVWWDQGMGDPLDPDAAPASPRKKVEEDGPSPKRVEQPQRKEESWRSKVASIIPSYRL